MYGWQKKDIIVSAVFLETTLLTENIRKIGDKILLKESAVLPKTAENSFLIPTFTPALSEE